jgi:acyl dehydratase
LLEHYGAATNDPNARVRTGEAVPPAAVVTQIWAAQDESRDRLVADHVRTASTGGVHGEHDIVLHRPIRVGERLRTWVDGYGSKPAGRNALTVLRYTTVDDRDEVVAEQLWTTVYFGVTCAAAGAALPEHDLPDEAREAPIGEYRVHVDGDMARRYAEVSGDWSAHHFEAEAAAHSGFDRVFLHGMCTLALAAQGVVAAAAGGDPDRVRRLATRFTSPTFLGEDLAVAMYEIGPGVIGFEATSAGAFVLRQGRVELRP